MRFELNRLLMTATAMLLALVLAGCETDGPEFAGGETTLLIDGVIEVDESSDTHFQAVTRSGTVNIEATDFTVIDPEPGVALEDQVLGVSVGQPDPEDESRCRVTFSRTLAVGESFSVSSREAVFCLVVFRTPDPQADTVVRYVLTLSGAFS